MENTHDRVAAVRKQANLTQKGFAERLNVSQAYVSSLEKGKRELSRTVISALADIFNVSPNWLLRGEGSQYMAASAAAGGDVAEFGGETAPQAATRNFMLAHRHGIDYYLSGQKERILPITINESNEPNIVLVPVKAQAGYAVGRVETQYMRDLPVFSLPDSRFRNGTFRAFEISGDSMEPTLFNNDIVVCRHIQDWRWLRDNELYVVVMKEDILVKRIRNRVREEAILELISDNRFYPPFAVPVEEVLEVWQVFARLTLHIPSPQNVANT